MGWIEIESFRFFCPAFADEFIWCETFQGLQSASIIVCVDEIIQVAHQLFVVVIMEAFDGCLFDCPVHPLDLTICPWVFWFRQAMFDTIFAAAHIEHVCCIPGRRPIFVTRWVGELDSIIRKNRMYFVRNRFDNCHKEG